MLIPNVLIDAHAASLSYRNSLLRLDLAISLHVEVLIRLQRVHLVGWELRAGNQVCR